MEARKEIETEYRIENGIIRSPGKFEGEPIYAPALYASVLNGLQDETIDFDEGPMDVLIIGPEMRAEFPELSDCYAVTLWEDSSGFVHTRQVSREELEKVREQAETDTEVPWDAD